MRCRGTAIIVRTSICHHRQPAHIETFGIAERGKVSSAYRPERMPRDRFTVSPSVKTLDRSRCCIQCQRNAVVKSRRIAQT